MTKEQIQAEINQLTDEMKAIVKRLNFLYEKLYQLTVKAVYKGVNHD